MARLHPLLRISAIFLCLGALAFAATEPSTPAAKLIKAARAQVGVTVVYDPAYVVLTYPGGDVPSDRGVCTDVVIRAMRSALDVDLQKAVHDDMVAYFSLYPKNWGLPRPDKNIDHRRVPNLQTYFKRHLQVEPVTDHPADYQPGDIVTTMLPGNLPHIMIISDQQTASGVPLVIHNIGQGAREEDSLFRFPLTAHYRLKAQP